LIGGDTRAGGQDAAADRADALREGEQVQPLPGRTDARLVFIGRIRTPFLTREQCPRQGGEDGPVCRLEIDEAWRPAIAGLEKYERIEVLYWLHQARRDLVTQSPKSDGRTIGTFALRSPVRPNPIATALVKLEGVEAGALLVRGLDCLDGTPLLDIKPDRRSYSPPAAPKAMG
jgi:tRNA (adenine37-N6)-methyltransferase